MSRKCPCVLFVSAQFIPRKCLYVQFMSRMCPCVLFVSSALFIPRKCLYVVPPLRPVQFMSRKRLCIVLFMWGPYLVPVNCWKRLSPVLFMSRMCPYPVLVVFWSPWSPVLFIFAELPVLTTYLELLCLLSWPLVLPGLVFRHVPQCPDLISRSPIACHGHALFLKAGFH